MPWTDIICCPCACLNAGLQLKTAVVVPLVDGGDQQVAPTLVTDVAAAVMQALRMPNSIGKTYCLAGPEALTWVACPVCTLWERVWHFACLHAEPCPDVPACVRGLPEASCSQRPPCACMCIPPVRRMREIVQLILATMREDEDPSLPVPRALAKLLAGPTDTISRMVRVGEADRQERVHVSKLPCTGCGGLLGHGHSAFYKPSVAHDVAHWMLFWRCSWRLDGWHSRVMLHFRSPLLPPRVAAAAAALPQLHVDQRLD
jgi:hypothetical protein